MNDLRELRDFSTPEAFEANSPSATSGRRACVILDPEMEFHRSLIPSGWSIMSSIHNGMRKNPSAMIISTPASQNRDRLCRSARHGSSLVYRTVLVQVVPVGATVVDVRMSTVLHFSTSKGQTEKSNWRGEGERKGQRSRRFEIFACGAGLESHRNTM